MIYNRSPRPAKKIKWRLLNSLKILVGVYLGLGIALYLLQDKFLFHPKALPARYIYRFSGPFVEKNMAVSKNDNLNFIQFLTSDTMKKGVVLYFHGNSENVSHYAKFAANFTKNGYEVWMPDYPGFGKSTGNLTEKKLYELASLLYKIAKIKYTSNEIVIYGKSLGTGIASQLASTKDCKLLILETPYYSIPDLFSYYAPVYPTTLISNFNLPVYQYLQSVDIPVVIFHGTSDEVIPYRCAAKLKNALKAADEFITIPGGKHNNLNDFEVLHTKINALLHN